MVPAISEKFCIYAKKNRYIQAPHTMPCRTGRRRHYGGCSGQPANRNKKCPDTHPEQPRRMTRAAGVIPKMHLRRRAVNDKCRSFQPRHLPLVIIPSPSILHKSGKGRASKALPFPCRILSDCLQLLGTNIERTLERTGHLVAGIARKVERQRVGLPAAGHGHRTFL